MNSAVYLEKLRKLYQQNPFVRYCGIVIDDAGCGWAKLHMPVKHELTNLVGYTHGGALSTLIDNAVGTTCRTVGAEVVTQTITTNFIRNTKEGTNIYAEGNILHLGSRTIVLKAILKDEEDRLMCEALATMFITGNDPNFPRNW